MSTTVLNCVFKMGLYYFLKRTGRTEEHEYERYGIYCCANGKTTAIAAFTKLEFKTLELHHVTALPRKIFEDEDNGHQLLPGTGGHGQLFEGINKFCGGRNKIIASGVLDRERCIGLTRLLGAAAYTVESTTAVSNREPGIESFLLPDKAMAKSNGLKSFSANSSGDSARQVWIK